jgi:hypothetical protein
MQRKLRPPFFFANADISAVSISPGRVYTLEKNIYIRLNLFLSMTCAALIRGTDARSMDRKELRVKSWILRS